MQCFSLKSKTVFFRKKMAIFLGCKSFKVGHDNKHSTGTLAFRSKQQVLIQSIVWTSTPPNVYVFFRRKEGTRQPKTLCTHFLFKFGINILYFFWFSTGDIYPLNTEIQLTFAKEFFPTFRTTWMIQSCGKNRKHDNCYKIPFPFHATNSNVTLFGWTICTFRRDSTFIFMDKPLKREK